MDPDECFGAVGDLHGDFDALDRVMARHPEVAFWVCPGDLASDARRVSRSRARRSTGSRATTKTSTSWPRSPRAAVPFRNLHYIPERLCVRAHGLVLAGLGGTFAPTWYETARAPTFAASRRDERQAAAFCARRGRLPADACRSSMSFCRTKRRGRFRSPRRERDAGKTPINEVLAAMQPRLHLFGHHHHYTVAERQHVPSIGLEMVVDSYLIFDGKTLAHQRSDNLIYSPRPEAYGAAVSARRE